MPWPWRPRTPWSPASTMPLGAPPPSWPALISAARASLPGSTRPRPRCCSRRTDHPRRPGQPQRRVHLPGRQRADHRLGHPGAPDQWRSALQRLLGDRLVGHARHHSVFTGTVMALTTITATTGVTLNGRLLARNGAVNLDTNRHHLRVCSRHGGGGAAPRHWGRDRRRHPPVAARPPDRWRHTTSRADPGGSKSTTAAKKRLAKLRAHKRAQQRAAHKRAQARARRRLARLRASGAHPHKPTSGRSFTG